MADATAQGGSSARDGETAALASEAHPHSTLTASNATLGVAGAQPAAKRATAGCKVPYGDGGSRQWFCGHSGTTQSVVTSDFFSTTSTRRQAADSNGVVVI